MRKLNRTPLALLAATAMAAAMGGAAAAQTTTLDELTITGHWRVGEDVRSLSAAVPYADLDLNSAGGRDILKQRIHDTARNLCDRLGETPGSTSAVPSCEQDAMTSARAQVKEAIAASRIPNYVYLPADEPYVAAAGPTAETATAYSAPASTVAPATVTTQTVTNGAVPDTPENRARFGGPMSRTGRGTAPAGN